MASDLQTRLTELAEIEDARPQEAIAGYRAVVLGDSANDTESIKAKEQAITKLSALYVKHNDAAALRAFLTDLRPLFGVIPKAKTAKIVRNIIESIAKISGSAQLQLAVCKEQVEWATAEKRTFLRQRIQARLASLYLETKEFQSALSLISNLLSEVKRLEDKLLLVDIHLIESRTHYLLRNQPKAKAALTAARTQANAIYIPPSLQGEIDTQSGILHADEKDYKTAYSYFFESFEQFSALDDPRAISSLKYMLLCKVMTSDAHEVPSIISSKAGLKYAGPDLDALRAIAKAYEDRSLQAFQDALSAYKAQLVDDPIVHTHLSALYDTMLEQNLSRIIEPYSRVEVTHVAKLINLPLETVEGKLSQMILDKKVAGTLNQGEGNLELFEDPSPDVVYPTALETFDSIGRVVDTLFTRSQKIVV